MSTQPPEHDALQARISELLREQPLRQAPPTLHGRVMAVLAHHHRRGWFMRWPLPAQAALVALSVLMAKIAMDLSMLVGNSMHAVNVPRVPAATAFGEAVLALVRNLPHEWLYGAVALLMLVYGGLFAIGTAVYRMLYLQRDPWGST